MILLISSTENFLFHFLMVLSSASSWRPSVKPFPPWIAQFTQSNTCDHASFVGKCPHLRAKYSPLLNFALANSAMGSIRWAQSVMATLSRIPLSIQFPSLNTSQMGCVGAVFCSIPLLPWLSGYGAVWLVGQS